MNSVQFFIFILSSNKFCYTLHLYTLLAFHIITGNNHLFATTIFAFYVFWSTSIFFHKKSIFIFPNHTQFIVSPPPFYNYFDLWFRVISPFVRYGFFGWAFFSRISIFALNRFDEFSFFPLYAATNLWTWIELRINWAVLKMEFEKKEEKEADEREERNEWKNVKQTTANICSH